MNTRTSTRMKFPRIRPMIGILTAASLAGAGILPLAAQQAAPAVKAKPEIAIQQPFGTKLVDGKTKRSFGTVVIGGSSASKAFKIRNKGNLRLKGIRVAVSGANAAEFEVGPISVASLAPNEEVVFKVIFKPKAAGTRVAKLRVFSNDKNENPFDIALAGRGVKK